MWLEPRIDHCTWTWIQPYRILFSFTSVDKSFEYGLMMLLRGLPSTLFCFSSRSFSLSFIMRSVSFIEVTKLVKFYSQLISESFSRFAGFIWMWVDCGCCLATDLNTLKLPSSVALNRLGLFSSAYSLCALENELLKWLLVIGFERSTVGFLLSSLILIGLADTAFVAASSLMFFSPPTRRLQMQLTGKHSWLIYEISLENIRA